MVQPSFGHDDDPVMKAARRSFRVRPTKNSDLFTESAVKFAAKTFWARVTTPRSVELYRAVGKQFVGIGLLILATMAAMVVWVGERLAELGLLSFGASKQALKQVGKGAGKVGRGVSNTGRGLSRGVKDGAIGFGEGIGSVGRGVSDVSRGVAIGVNRGVEKASHGAATVGRGVNKVGSRVGKVGGGVKRAGKKGVRSVGHGVGSVGRGVDSVGRSAGGFGLGLGRSVAGGMARLSRVARAVRWTVNDYRRRTNAGVQWMASRFGSASSRIARWTWRISSPIVVVTARGIRRHLYAVATVSFSLVLLLTAPVTGALLGDLLQATRAKVSSATDPVFPIVVKVPDVSVPEVKIPRVSFRRPRLPEVSLDDIRMPDVDVPDISIQWPAFVAVPIKRLDEMLAGPLIESGARILVADFDGDGIPATGVGQALALVVETELSSVRRFTVMPRERVLAGMTTGKGETTFALDAKRAVSFAATSGAAGVVTGRFVVADGTLQLDLILLDPWGEEAYEITSLAAESELVDATVQAARDLKRRLGEPDGDAVQGLGPLLSGSLPALTAYAEARYQLWRGRYWSTINSAAAATRIDTAFAAAHHLSATAYALVGQRWRARQALESAWQYRGRLSERERLRLAADREVFRGRLSQAIAGYDMLFSLYRDDIAALKSQAIVQRMIGARGHGTGNLRVAYSIDPVDWPPLERVARFLGYRGRIPAIDEFAKAPMRPAPTGPLD